MTEVDTTQLSTFVAIAKKKLEEKKYRECWTTLSGIQMILLYLEGKNLFDQ